MARIQLIVISLIVTVSCFLTVITPATAGKVVATNNSDESMVVQIESYKWHLLNFKWEYNDEFNLMVGPGMTGIYDDFVYSITRIRVRANRGGDHYLLFNHNDGKNFYLPNPQNPARKVKIKILNKERVEAEVYY